LMSPFCLQNDKNILYKTMERKKKKKAWYFFVIIIIGSTMKRSLKQS